MALGEANLRVPPKLPKGSFIRKKIIMDENEIQEGAVEQTAGGDEEVANGDGSGAESEATGEVSE